MIILNTLKKVPSKVNTELYLSFNFYVRIFWRQNSEENEERETKELGWDG